MKCSWVVGRFSPGILSLRSHWGSPPISFSKLPLGLLLYVFIWGAVCCGNEEILLVCSKPSCPSPVLLALEASSCPPPLPTTHLPGPSWTLPHCALRPLPSPRTEGALELHTHYLIPSRRQVVFQGDRLPFQCSASYLGNDTHIRWYHNRAPVDSNEQAGILLAESLIHDCTIITR